MAEADKRHLYQTARMVVAVDMESHIAARIAAAHNVPFAACRVIIDPAKRTLPPAALVGTRADGKPGVLAVIRSLTQQLRQLRVLLRVIADARAARTALFRGRHLLGANLSLPHSNAMPFASVALSGCGRRRFAFRLAQSRFLVALKVDTTSHRRSPCHRAAAPIRNRPVRGNFPCLTEIKHAGTWIRYLVF